MEERATLILATIISTLILLKLFDLSLPYLFVLFSFWGYFWLHWVLIAMDLVFAYFFEED